MRRQFILVLFVFLKKNFDAKVRLFSRKMPPPSIRVVFFVKTRIFALDLKKMRE